MPAVIDPATGESGSISPTGRRFNVSSRSDDRIYYISRDNGDAYSIVSIDTPSGANEYNLYFKNTHTTKKFHITSVRCGSAVLASFKISKVTGTAAGTTITPTNLNTTSGNPAQATCFGNGAVTGLTESAVIAVVRVVADSSDMYDFKDSFILGKDEAFAIEYDIGGGGTVDLTVIGFFDSE